MKLYLGLTGKPRAGKGTFIEVLKEINPHLKITAYGTGALIRKTLGFWDIELSRPNQQCFAEIMSENFGEDIISKAIKAIAIKDSSDIVIIDGMRWPADYEMLMSLDEPKKAESYLVFINADPGVRYRRTISTGSPSNSEKVGEEVLSRDDFLRQDNTKTEQFIKEMGSKADYIIQNHSDGKEKYREEIERFSKSLYHYFPFLKPA